MQTVEEKIKRFIRYYEFMLGCHDPVRIAKFLGIGVAIVPLGAIAGNYKLIKRKRWIFINEDLEVGSPMFNVAAAHELGHALLHRTVNCAFMKHYTMLITSGVEREANQFAANLLISDDMVKEYAGLTVNQFCDCTGYPPELIELRLKEFKAK